MVDNGLRDRERRDVLDFGERAHRVPIEAGRVRQRHDVGTTTARLQAIERAGVAPGAGERRERGAAGERDEQRQDGQRTPSPPKITSRPPADGSHARIQPDGARKHKPAHARTQGGASTP
jgi:hypothetical protein